NLDVFADETLTPACRLDPAPPSLPLLAAEIKAAREHAAADVSQMAGPARFRDLLIEVTAWVDTGAWLSRPPPGEPALPFAAFALKERRRKLLKDGRHLAALSDPERHQVRIDAKKLRYAAEGFQCLYSRKGTAKFIKAL